MFCRPFADLERITKSSAYKRQFIDFSPRVMSAELAVVFSSLQGKSLRQNLKRAGDNIEPCFTPEWIDILTAQGRGRWLVDLSLNWTEEKHHFLFARPGDI